MRPFFCFYGGKWRAARRYSPPIYDTIIDSFCGAAGYSCRYPHKNIILIDKDPLIFGLWKYLISANELRIKELPDLKDGQTIDDLTDLEPAERHLIGFWLNKGTTRPSKSPSSWMRSGVRPKSYWGKEVREVLSSQLYMIRKWTVLNCSYDEIENREATWFVDPPYKEAGSYYVHGSSSIDYIKLGDWCKSRLGQTIVCENVGADWLPFKEFSTIKSTPGKRGKGYSKEAVWENNFAQRV